MSASLRTVAMLTVLSALPSAACTSATADGGETAAEAVTTSRCPAAFTIKLTEVTPLRSTPTKYYDGRVLSADERARTKAAMDVARSLPREVLLSVGSVVKSRGTCTYEGTDDTKVVLRTKNGKDRADIFYKNYRIYAPLTSYGTDGIKIDSRRAVSFFSNVVASNPTDDQPSLNVRIGHVTVAAEAALPPVNEESWLRVPVLDENDVLLHTLDPSFPKTIHLPWGQDGVTAYTALEQRAEAAGYELMMFATPSSYETPDPATSICFTGREMDVCDLIPWYADNLFSDMFTMEEDDDGNVVCSSTRDMVRFGYYVSEADIASSADIPRCR